MLNIHRYYILNAIVFITTGTRKHDSCLQSDEDIELFWEISYREKEIHHFRLLA